jgi:hypothetical protein
MVTVRAFPSLIGRDVSIACEFRSRFCSRPSIPTARVLSVLAIAAVVSSVARQPDAGAARDACQSRARIERRRGARRASLAFCAPDSLRCRSARVYCSSWRRFGFVERSTSIANPDSTRNYERVADVRVAPRLRAAVRCPVSPASPAVEQIAAALAAADDGDASVPRCPRL